ncbi:general stress protein [Paenibacillus humicola]|uniref:general stress protein n=1 Tax=Paenibacillus humicola TaxID=3110540 RepID=UPI00237B8D9A|nr:general stress protein [Paenibacillus humicola]
MGINEIKDVRLTNVHTVNTLGEAREQLERYRQLGYSDDRLFVLTHEDERTKRLAEETDTGRIGVFEEGIGTAIANIFRSKGDELRAKMRSVGIADDVAEKLERELDRDKIVVIAWGGTPYENGEYDPAIVYYPPYYL